MIRDVTPQTAYFNNNYIKTLVKISETAKKRVRNKSLSDQIKEENHINNNFLHYNRSNSLVNRKKMKKLRKIKKIEEMKIKEREEIRGETLSQLAVFEKKFNVMKSGTNAERNFKGNDDISEIKKEGFKTTDLFSKTDDVLEILPFIEKDEIIEARGVVKRSGKKIIAKSFGDI